MGSNVASSAGTLAQTLEAALTLLERESVRISKVSRFYHTPCVPAGAGPDFVNAVARIVSDLSPAALLERLHAVEARMGRERRVRWGARTLDLDLLDLGGAILPDAAVQAEWMALDPAEQARRAPDRLILPHPRIQDRAFVLVPLAEIAPDWRHPVLGLTARALRDALPAAELARISPISAA